MKEKQIQYKTTNKITEEIINEILEIKKKFGLTAEKIIEIANDKTNPLHNFFEWNNSKAGNQWRIQQARVLINEVKIIVGDKEHSAFENITIDIGTPQEQRVYLERSEILSDEQLKKQFIISALQKVNYWKEQCESYNGSIVKELQPIFSSIEKVNTKWEKKQ